MSNGFDGNSQTPFPLVTSGKGYTRVLQARSQAILNTLMGYLASNYRATVPSTEYAYYLRSMAVELARLTIALEHLSGDISFEDVRSEFLHQVVGYLLFRDELPDIDFDDEEFREFLLKIIEIYFQGSTPKSIRDAVELFTDADFEVKELFLESRDPNSPYDISDQFGFTIEFDLSGGFPDDLFRLQSNIELLVNIVKPAHTLYNISYAFPDGFDSVDNAEDDLTWEMHDRRYDDFRKFCRGMSGWTSTTGYIESGSLDVLKDDAVSSPLTSVNPGATLVVLAGANSERYRVTEVVGTNGVRVRPRFRIAQDPVEYKVEVDREGYNYERFVDEDLSGQFVSPQALEVYINGPFTVFQFAPVTMTASSNYGGDMIYEWDLTEDGVFTDATGAVTTYNAGAGPNVVTVGVRGTSADGRVARAETEIYIIGDALTVDAGGPYATTSCLPVVLTSVSSGGTVPVSYTWSSNGVDFTLPGQMTTFTPTENGQVTIWVRAEDSVGQLAYDSALVDVSGCLGVTYGGAALLSGSGTIVASGEALAAGAAALSASATVSADITNANPVFDFGTPSEITESVNFVASLESDDVLTTYLVGNESRIRVWDAPTELPVAENVTGRGPASSIAVNALGSGYVFTREVTPGVYEPELTKVTVSTTATQWVKEYAIGGADDLTGSFAAFDAIGVDCTTDDSVVLLNSARTGVYQVNPANGDIQGNLNTKYPGWNSGLQVSEDPEGFALGPDGDTFLVRVGENNTGSYSTQAFQAYTVADMNATTTGLPYATAVDAPDWSVGIYSLINSSIDITATFRTCIRSDRQPGGGWWVSWGTGYGDQPYTPSGGGFYKRYMWHITKAGVVDISIDFQADVDASIRSVANLCVTANGQPIIPVEYVNGSVISGFAIFEPDGTFVGFGDLSSIYATDIFTTMSEGTDTILSAGTFSTAEAIFVPLVEV